VTSKTKKGRSRLFKFRNFNSIFLQVLRLHDSITSVNEQ